MKPVVILPTFNESENIGDLVREILAVEPSLHVLVVDDASPDGTAAAAAVSPRVRVLRRTGRRGRGLAGIEGFRYALREGHDPILEMDADFSHSPEYIPLFLEEIKKYDVVIGSRFVPGGGETGRPFYRRLLSRMANGAARHLLGLNVRDCTSGFRCFKRRVLESIDLERLISAGPSVVEEILLACRRKGYDIHEVPIIFRERRRGRSKLGLTRLAGALWAIARLSLKKARRPATINDGAF